MRIVSVIVPCYNEEKTIELLLQSLVSQTYPLTHIEVVIADGLSTDQTRNKIGDFQKRHSDLNVRIIDNPRKVIPAGLNAALQAATGEIIVRVDAHCAPKEDYIARCVDALEKGLGENVGGVWEITPPRQTWQALGIAAAAAHPFGVGDAYYRHTEKAMWVDTVPFGSFFHRLIEQIGYFDEQLLANEDYEFNVRIRQAGGKIWLDPAIRSTYFSRGNFIELARQYWRYGYWKAKMLRRYPDTIRWRQALPPLFVLSIPGLALLSIWLPFARWIIMLELLAYVLVLMAAGLQVALKKKDIGYMISVPLAIATMHLCWGSAFLWSLLKG
jgi:glycosyltransferase involved in cell wall biosynthesis